MNKTKEKRTAVLPLIRVTPTEKECIKNSFLASHFPTQSAYIRAKLLATKVSDFQKKRFEAELQAGALVDELTRIGVNINQIARARNSEKVGKLDREELLVLTSALQLINKIKSILSQK